MAAGEDEIKSLLRMNIYGSKDEVVAEAVRALLESKPKLRVEIAVDLYKNGEASLWRASEIAGLSLEEFKEVLAARSIKIEISGTKEESRKRLSKALGV
jgi:predicted HTH domain antitoxin